MTELEKVLSRFVGNSDLSEACMALLDYFKIKFTQISPASLPADVFFNEEFIKKKPELIGKLKQISVVGIASQDTFLSAERGIISTEEMERQIENEHYKEMAFFSIDVNAKLTRTEISTLTRAFNRRVLYKPVVLFIRYGELLSLSTCERSEYVKTGYEGEKVGKVTILRDINCKNTHRGHLDILESLDISKCKSFSAVLTAWLDTFSNELLTKKFYQKLYCWYQWAIEPSTGVFFPIMQDNSADRNITSTNIIRLITRLLFVWFIKQKGLTPDCLFDEEYLSSLLKNFDPQSQQDSNYYNAILQNLFFATLNKQVNKRAFSNSTSENNPHEGVKTLFRDNDSDSWFTVSHSAILNLFRPIPFMNCGLFECLDKYANADIDTNRDSFIDGFSSNSQIQNGTLKYRSFIPNRLFFAEEHDEIVTVEDDNGNPTQETIKVMGLIPLLKKYQFTVEENTPTDVEVSLDPELLGQVFENLLATYNPETHASARKSTGSYYTPRRIVEYMVNESLVEYLNTQIDRNMEKTWRALISYEDEPFELTKEERLTVLEKILNCKVLDPACGSGAFPMGMLQQMVHIVRRIDPTNEMWRDLVLEHTQQEINRLLLERKDSKDNRHDIEERRAEVMKAFDNSIDNPDYTRKLYIIQNCIYGSDIQPIAMLISKLRFFISLICEQDTSNMDLSDTIHNYGIDTLPNLETKFVAADSLSFAKVRNFEDDEWTIDKNLVKLKNELLEIRQSHFMANTQEKKLAKRAEDERKRRDIYNYILNQHTKPDEEKIVACETRIKQLEDERKTVEKEIFQDVIVSIPASLFDEAQTKTVNIDINKESRDKIDSQINQLKREIKKEKSKENKSDFVSAVNQITSWNPYDQINPAPFFDPDWMFNVNGGFDIVIGNPPYIALPKNNPYKDYQTGKCREMYVCFFERGLSMLHDNGILSYITASLYVKGVKFDALRTYLENNSSLIRFRNEGDNVFEGVKMPTSTILLRNAVGNWSFNHIIGGGSVYSLIDGQPLKDISEIRRGFEIGKDKVSSSGAYPIITGTDATFYYYKNKSYISQSTFSKYSKDLKFYHGKRLLLRETGSKLMSLYLDENIYCNRSLYSIIITDSRYNPMYVCACLNSKVLQFYYHIRFKAETDLFPKIRIAQAKLLPIPLAKSELQEQIAELVSSCINKIKAGEDPDNYQDEINSLVCQAYSISEEQLSKEFNAVLLSKDSIKDDE